MTAQAMVATAALLAMYLLFAGAYGTLYALARRLRRRGLTNGAMAAFAGQFAVLVAILSLTPLASPWKIMLTLMTLAFLVSPPVVWRLLDRMHAPDPRSN